MKNILAVLAFYARYKDWHSFSQTDRPTRRAIKSLERLGFLKVSWSTHQAKFTGKVFANHK